MMRRRLGTIPVLAITGAIMIACHLVIHVFFVPGTGGTLLDFQLTGAAAEEALMLLKSRPNAVGVHLYLSAGVDMVYPLSYGLFVAGVCIRYGGQHGVMLAVPILGAAAVDISENIVQIIALAGDTSVLWLKSILTPAKFVLAAIGSCLAILAWARTTFSLRKTDQL
ncbi:MAG: hypothetical protein AAF216_12190 [Pseudomonadota bacterium]